MHKILDNTFISAVRIEISSVDVLSKIISEYTVITTPEVVCEASCRDIDLSALGIDTVVESSDAAINTMSYLKRTHQWIGLGELSVIVSSMILTHNGVYNFIITDDARARSLINVIHEDPLIAKYLGFEPKKIDYAGTVGLIAHLKDKGKITKAECRSIKLDLKDSGFRITPDILSILD